MNERSPRIVTVLGTSRPGNLTSRALDVVEEALRSRGADVERVDPAELELPFPGEGSTADAERLRATVAEASAVVLATPEYHGAFAARLKLVIENLGFPSVLAGKPVALLGVAAGRIGAIKSLEQLRSVASHVGAVVLPGPVSVAGARAALGADGDPDASTTESLEDLAGRVLDYLRDHVCPKVTLERMVRGLDTADS